MTAALLPPFDLSALAWVCLLPLLAVMWSVPSKRAGWWGFGLGWAAGFLVFLLQTSWLSTVTLLGALILPAYLGLYWGVFGVFAATVCNPWKSGDGERCNSGGGWESLKTAARLASIWGFLEWLRGWLLTGFGWNGLGVAFHESLVIAQAADLLGVTGLSMLVVFFQSVLLHAGRRLLGGLRGGRWSRWDFAVACMLVGCCLCYGLIRIAIEAGRESIRLKALLVQINIPQDAAKVLWDAHRVHMAYEEETLNGLQSIVEQDDAMMREAIASGAVTRMALRWPDWVIWPETALTGRLLSAPDGAWGTWHENLETIRRVREAGDFHLIFGINELEAEYAADGQLIWKEGGRIWNSLAIMDPDDELQTFRKRHLVIFGEYIPFVSSIPFLKRVYEQQSGAAYGGAFTPGDSFDPLDTHGGGGSIEVIPSVCFEDSVPRLKRKFVRPVPQVIVNVTNDGWFKESAAAAQHFANARFRAIELRRPMLRAANTGVTAAIDTRGSTAHPETSADQRLRDDAGSHFTRGSLLVEVDVPIVPGFSLYAWWGDWPVIGLGCLGIFSAFVGSRTARMKIW